MHVGVELAVVVAVVVAGLVLLRVVVSGVLRATQSGYLYHYAFAMILGLIGLLGALIWLWN